MTPDDEFHWRVGAAAALYLGVGVCVYDSEMALEECEGHVIVRAADVRAVHDGVEAWWVYREDCEPVKVMDAQVEALIRRRPVPLPS